MSNDFRHINCHLVLIAADALTPDQLERKRLGKSAIEPLSESSIEDVLDAWREKLKREIASSGGYFVFGYDT